MRKSRTIPSDSLVLMTLADLRSHRQWLLTDRTENTLDVLRLMNEKDQLGHEIAQTEDAFVSLEAAAEVPV